MKATTNFKSVRVLIEKCPFLAALKATMTIGLRLFNLFHYFSLSFLHR